MYLYNDITIKFLICCKQVYQKVAFSSDTAYLIVTDCHPSFNFSPPEAIGYFVL